MSRKEPRVDSKQKENNKNKQEINKRNVNFRKRRGGFRGRARGRLRDNRNFNIRTLKRSTNLARSTVRRYRTRDAKLHYLLNPMLAVLERRLFSIFATDQNVLRLTVFNSFNLSVDGFGKRLSWYPMGVGFVFPNNIPKDASGNNCTQFAPLYYIQGDGNNTEHLYYYSTTNFTVYGRYRVIGSELKITNTTNITNRGGSFLVAEINCQSGIPLYCNSGYLAYNALDADQNVLRDDIKSNLEAQATKQMFTADDTALIRYTNCSESNRIYSSYREYMQNGYSTDLTFDHHCRIIGDNIIGNNNCFVVHFYPVSTSNRYLIEAYTVIELIPEPATNMGSSCYPSPVTCSKRQMRILNNMQKIIKPSK